MRIVRLIPATKRLKQVRKVHGELWRVLHEAPVLCFDGAQGLFIESLDGTHTRWVLPSQTLEVQS